MAILPIRVWGDPVLHSEAEPVERVDSTIRDLVQDMYQTMDAAPGVGLAAPQIGVPLRIYTYVYPRGSEQWRGAIINPKLWMKPLQPGAPDPESESEGCLSFPGESFPLRRSPRVVVTGLDLNGGRVRLKVSGWRARIMQHEFDHLNGILYIDRLLPRYHREAMAIAEQQGWGGPGNSWTPDP